MKKLNSLFCILFIGLVFASCEKEDDGNSANGNGSVEELLVGTWQWQDLIEDGESLGLTECETKSTFQFNGNGTFEAVQYYDLNEGGQVICENESTTGQWNYLGDDKLEVKVFEYTDVVKISFSGNGNILSLRQEYEDGYDESIFARVE